MDLVLDRAPRGTDETNMALDESVASGLGERLEAARLTAELSPRRLARKSGVALRRLSALEKGSAVPTDHELGALAQACEVSVFDLLPPAYALRVLARDDTTGAREVDGGDACDVLLREYLSMVVELRSGRVIAPPTLRRDDLVELAGALGDTPEGVEARLLELLTTTTTTTTTTTSGPFERP
jgi:transcriptional regulator with XRE-family HTH domain